MGRDFSYFIYRHGYEPDEFDDQGNYTLIDWERDFNLRNNEYLPYDEKYTKDELLDLITEMEFDINTIDQYGDAIKTLTHIYIMMYDDDIVHLHNM